MKQNFDVTHKISQCACLRVKDLSWTDCECLEKQHTVCRMWTNQEEVNEHLFFTTNNLSESGLDREDDNIDTKIGMNRHHRPPILSNLILTINTTKEAVNVPRAEAIKSLNEHIEIENVEEMEKDLMGLANYLLSADFNDLLLNSTFYDYDSLENENMNKASEELRLLKEDLNHTPTISDNLAIKKLLNETLISIDANNTNQFRRTELLLAKAQLLKQTTAFTSNCRHGFGFYSLNSDIECNQYLKCENLNQNYAIISLYKCINNHKFDFKRLKCLISDSKCDATKSSFVPF